VEWIPQTAAIDTARTAPGKAPQTDELLLPASVAATNIELEKRCCFCCCRSPTRTSKKRSSIRKTLVAAYPARGKAPEIQHPGSAEADQLYPAIVVPSKYALLLSFSGQCCPFSLLPQLL
jgi:hypothetical protein